MFPDVLKIVAHEILMEENLQNLSLNYVNKDILVKSFINLFHGSFVFFMDLMNKSLLKSYYSGSVPMKQVLLFLTGCFLYSYLPEIL